MILFSGLSRFRAPLYRDGRSALNRDTIVPVVLFETREYTMVIRNHFYYVIPCLLTEMCLHIVPVKAMENTGRGKHIS